MRSVVIVALSVALAACSDSTRPTPVEPAECPATTDPTEETLEVDLRPDWCWGRPDLIAYEHHALTLEDVRVHGEFQIWIVNVATGERQYVTRGIQPSWSPDGNRIAFTSVGRENTIWTVDLTTGHKTQLTSGPETGHSPDWSPVGTAIAYMTMRGPEGDGLAVVDADTGIRRLLLDMWAWFPDWCPDGNTFVAQMYHDLVLLIPPDSLEVLLHPTTYSVVAPSCSRDGKNVAFQAVSPNHHFDVRVLDRVTGDVQVISGPGGMSPSWAPDGSAVVYASFDSTTGFGTLYLSKLDESPCRRLTTLSDYIDPDSLWTVSQRRIAEIRRFRGAGEDQRVPRQQPAAALNGPA